MQDLVVVAVVCSPSTPRSLADQLIVSLNEVSHREMSLNLASRDHSVVSEPGQFVARMWSERDELDDAVEVVVDLSWPHSLDADHASASERLLRRVGTLPHSVCRYIFLSSGFVYGPRELAFEQPTMEGFVGVDENTPVASQFDFNAFTQLVLAERAIEKISHERDNFACCTLRPSIVVDADHSAWMYDELSGLVSTPGESVERRVQYLTSDDLAAAIVHLVINPLKGVVNVSPRGSMTVREARAISGDVPSMALPASLSRVAEMPSKVFGLFRSVPFLGAYLTQSTILSSKRLETSGWKATCSSEEALVASVRGSWWSQLSPKRRQEMALGVAAFSLVSLAGAVAFGVIRRRRR